MLDVGCGEGRHIFGFMDVHANVNCVGIDCNLCCEEQKDKTLYPNLLSPDYAFGQDYYIRNEENIKKHLLDKNLRTDFNININ